MVMVDQRNHGASSEVQGLHPPHSIEASAGDLLNLVHQKLSGRVPDMLIGHSLGGKTVVELLRLLQESGQPMPKQVSEQSLLPDICIALTIAFLLFARTSRLYRVGAC